jgi:hypothetical protein
MHLALKGMGKSSTRSGNVTKAVTYAIRQSNGVVTATPTIGWGRGVMMSTPHFGQGKGTMAWTPTKRKRTLTRRICIPQEANPLSASQKVDDDDKRQWMVLMQEEC